MKPTIIVLAFILAGCSSPLVWNGNEYQAHTLEEAWAKASSYRYIVDTIDDPKSPQQFEADGGGDCEDFAVYMVYLLGSESFVVCGQNSEGQGHAFVEYQGEWIEPQVYGMKYSGSDFKNLTRYSYAAAMQWAAARDITGNHTTK